LAKADYRAVQFTRRLQVTVTRPSVPPELDLDDHVDSSSMLLTGFVTYRVSGYVGKIAHGSIISV
jgi:hypothetical protein